VADDLCQQCRHAFDPHVMVATTGEAADGGVMLCPVPGCECYGTWGLDGGPTARIPDRFEVAALREQVQHRA
jgi:hypothetical protein